jgi:hypothetical protein
MAIEYGGMLVCLGFAPTLFSLLSPRWVVGLAGAATIGVAAAGWFGFKKDQDYGSVLTVSS